MTTSEEGLKMRKLINTAKNATEIKVSVKHMEGSSRYKSEDYRWESWKAFWSEYTNNKIPQQNYFCPSCNEYKDDIVGEHVIYNDKMYITPICSSCNSRAVKDIKFRNTPFEVAFNKLCQFNPDELKKRHG